MTEQTQVHGSPSDDLLRAFWAYEHALLANDLEALDSLFHDSPSTLRGDAQGLVVGHEAISAFRRSRRGAPSRTLESIHVQMVTPSAALIMAVTAPSTGGRGLQTQLWRCRDGRWQVDAAHVSSPPPPAPPSKEQGG